MKRYSTLHLRSKKRLQGPFAKLPKRVFSAAGESVTLNTHLGTIDLVDLINKLVVALSHLHPHLPLDQQKQVERLLFGFDPGDGGGRRGGLEQLDQQLVGLIIDTGTVDFLDAAKSLNEATALAEAAQADITQTIQAIQKTAQALNLITKVIGFVA